MFLGYREWIRFVLVVVGLVVDLAWNPIRCSCICLWYCIICRQLPYATSSNEPQWRRGQRLATTRNISAFNLANTFGGFLGGMVLDSQPRRRNDSIRSRCYVQWLVLCLLRKPAIWKATKRLFSASRKQITRLVAPIQNESPCVKNKVKTMNKLFETTKTKDPRTTKPCQLWRPWRALVQTNLETCQMRNDGNTTNNVPVRGSSFDWNTNLRWLSIFIPLPVFTQANKWRLARCRLCC